MAATLAQLRLSFGDAGQFTVHAPIPPAFGDEGAANHMRLAPAYGEPGVEIFVYGVSGGAFTARQSFRSVKGHRPPATASTRRGPCFRRAVGQQSPPARSTTMSVAVANGRCCSRERKHSPSGTGWLTIASD